jgi:hypothetical protein
MGQTNGGIHGNHIVQLCAVGEHMGCLVDDPEVLFRVGADDS